MQDFNKFKSFRVVPPGEMEFVECFGSGRLCLSLLNDRSFLGMTLGSIDFFRIWSLISLAIGLGVLYKRRASPIAWTLLAVYVVIVLCIAGVRAALAGA